MSTNPYADVTRRDLFHSDHLAPRAVYVRRAKRIDQVCDLVAEGFTNDEIAAALDMQSISVAGIIHQAYAEAGITCRKHATRRVRLVLWHLKRTGRLRHE